MDKSHVFVYNPDNDQYLAVWEAVNSFGYSTVTGRRLTGSGTVTTTDSIAISTSQATQSAADITYREDTHQYLVLWQQIGGGYTQDIYGRGVLPDGTLAGGATAVANTAQSETHPRLAASTQGILAVWQRQNTSSGYDLYARTLDGNGLPNGDPFVIQETAGNQQNVAVAAGSNLRTQLAWQDDREGGWDLFTASLDRSYQVMHIQYEYDPLYRLVHADYDGDFNGEYRYAYDAVGNRTTYTTTITSTTVITYHYDAANRLLESVEIGGDTTTYDWDDAGRLITTTVGVNVSRVYTYSQDGDMTAALVDGLLTTFVYDGQGHRLQMAVAGEVTTYTLDYARGFRVLLEEGGVFSDIKHYLYGLECVGELVDADEPESEWRYYHLDGNHLVRQTTNVQATVTLAWIYSPEGAVILGEEGLVTHLGCDGNTTYDFSTGLIFKNGNYFDPNTGIWITLGGLVVWNGWQSGVNTRKRERQRSKRSQKWLLLLLLFLIVLVLAGCGPAPGPTPGATPCPEPPTISSGALTPAPMPLPPTATATIPPSPTATLTPSSTPEPVYRLTTKNWGLVRVTYGSVGGVSWGAKNIEMTELALDMVLLATNSTTDNVSAWLRGSSAKFEFLSEHGPGVAAGYLPNPSRMYLYQGDIDNSFVSRFGLFFILHEIGHAIDYSLGEYAASGRYNPDNNWQNDGGGWIYTGDYEYGSSVSFPTYNVSPGEEFGNTFASYVIRRIEEMGKTTSINGTDLSGLIRTGDENGNGLVDGWEIAPVSPTRQNIMSDIFKQIQSGPPTGAPYEYNP